jgi:glucose-1-phosphate adenylyltransferase
MSRADLLPASDLRRASRLTRDALALVMAGGRGSRLGPLTDHCAKPAVPFGGKFRIIDFTLSNCINSGLRRVGVLTQYRAHALLRHLQQGWSFLRGEFDEFVEMLPAQQRVDDSAWYAGTADAVYQNLDIVRMHAPRHVVILAGDHVYKMDYARMLAAHVESGAQLTIGCLEVPLAEATAFGVLQADGDGRVRRFAEKPCDPEPMPGKPDTALASMGIYVFDMEYLVEVLMRDAANPASRRDFGGDVIPAAIGVDRVFAHPFRDLHDPTRAGYWRDVGTLDAYWRANLELAGAVPDLDLYDDAWPVRGVRGTAAPAKFVPCAGGREGAATGSLVAEGSIVCGGTVQRCVLFSRVRVESHAEIDRSVILPGVTVGPRSRIVNAIIGEGCRLPEGIAIGLDPEADRERFFVTESGVVVVTQAALGQA